MEMRTFVMVNESSTEVESAPVASVDDEEEEREASTVPNRSFRVDVTALLDVAVVETGENALRAECLGSTDGGDDLLGKSSALGNVLQRHLHVLGDELVHDTTGNGDTREDGRHGEGESPAANVGEDETADESAKEVDDQSDLLGRALLDKV